jgi:hypothetical protein
LDTEHIQHHVTKTKQEYIVCDIVHPSSKLPKAKNIANNLFFYSNLLSIFFRICGYKPGFAVENSQNSV